ncbi:DUF2161 family putative PD-(D/E)XK-type phosphodiesterase [Acholeplasma vituli]|uniref:DUF2161 family putative PD-(D/E)XK-type phosphodiesterase n=1 Tax=Paracholeplasma vituli TaxID=69473 RepID=A0ABT2Q0P9_9MOLU|nr:DUF2161 family putative PD-(D/E)XK-type phosphodiesterase [Paracholeplasma vituli]MCU0105488.1 DUF2161 family putative PD-(D/E)XK-type phosphodiesterase [Paracholeplasma vituli]
MEEKELYLPIKKYLESKGYVIKAEVKDIDIVGVKEHHTIAVELKTTVSLKLIYQAIDRQKMCDKVYIGLPKSAIKSHQANMRQFIYLLKRLDIGLIQVSDNEASLLMESDGFDMKRSIAQNKRKKKAILKEFSLRESDENVGGMKGKKMTHYRERVLKIAHYLEEFKTGSPKDIKAFTGVMDTPNILQKNYYMWFKKVDRGIYTLTLMGEKALNEEKSIRSAKDKTID